MVEYIKVGVLHVILAIFVAIRPTPYLLYVLFMYGPMIVFALGNGSRIKANFEHFLKVLRTYNRIVILLVTLFVATFIAFGTLDKFVPFYIFNIGWFLSYNAVVLILAHMCPLLFGTTLLSIFRRQWREVR